MNKQRLYKAYYKGIIVGVFVSVCIVACGYMIYKSPKQTTCHHAMKLGRAGYIYEACDYTYNPGNKHMYLTDKQTGYIVQEWSCLAEDSCIYQIK